MKKYNLTSIGVFGSFSRDDFNDDSDIDILIEYDSPMGIEFIDLAYELEKLLNRPVDLVSRKGIKPKYSSNSDWIAYAINPDTSKSSKDISEVRLELKNLLTGKTRQFESNSRFQFTEKSNYFISSDNTSLPIYDLNSHREHFIGNIGETQSN